MQHQGGGTGELSWEAEIGIYALSKYKIEMKTDLYSTGHSTPCSVVIEMGKKFKKGGSIYTYN